MNHRTKSEENYVEKGSTRLHGITDGFNLWPLCGRMHKNRPANFAGKKGQKQRTAPGPPPKRAKPGAFWVLERVGEVEDG